MATSKTAPKRADDEQHEYDPKVTALFDVVKVRPELHNAVKKDGGEIIGSGKTREEARKAGYAKIKPAEVKEATEGK